MINYIDLIIIGLFLIGTFVIGICYTKRIKSFQEYAVGNRKMSITVITLSLIATTYDGSILNSRLDLYYRKGLYAFIMDLASPLNFYLASRFIITRAKEFISHLSIAESLGSLYGPIVQIITAILGMVMAIALLVVQIKVGFDIISIYIS